jgi:hypothetical protein
VIGETIIDESLLNYYKLLISIANQPDTLQNMTNSLLVNIDIPIKD